MDEPAANRWAGQSVEFILADVLHQLRAPIHTIVGSLTVLKTADRLTAEQTQQMIDLGLNSAVRAKHVIDTISQYMADKPNNE